MPDPLDKLFKDAPDIDARVREFQSPYCDVSRMRDAALLVAKDPQVQSLLPQIKPEEIDFNCDGNKRKDGTLGNASNREWGMAIVAAAQLAKSLQLPMSEVPEKEIVRKGKQLYDEFTQHEAELKAPPTPGKPKAAGTCKIGS